MFLSTKKLWMGMALVASLGYSCQHDESLGVEAITGFKIALVDEPSVTETRSTPQELGKPTTDNFTLKIVNSASGKSIYDAGYTKDIIKASAGVYDVTTSFGDNAVLAFDAPYYEGKKEDIAIEEGDTASVTVECAVANALASVTFEDSEKFKELYSSYAVEVAVENSSLKLEDGDKRSAYYRANSKPTFTFKGVLKANGKSVEAELEDKILSDPATFAAKAHCRLTLALKEMVPGIIPTIVKTEVDTVTVSETLPMEWLPAPKVSATGFGENRTLDVYETAPTEASIDFTLSSPLQDIDFSVNFADENLQSLNGDYTLSALTNEQRLDFINAGIDIPIIGEDKPSVRFSNTLTGALLATNEGVVNNTFTLKSVKANDRTNADGALTYTIATHKPEFTVSVLPGNIWTKEFTVSALTEEQVEKGDYSKLSQKMMYQFSTDGSTGWTDLGEDLRKAELTPNTSYFVRGVYRNEICSAPVEVKTYPIIELENGDMEDWTEEERGYYYSANIFDRNPAKLRVYYPWKGVSYWNTNNDFTTRNRDASTAAFSIVYRYNSFPAVSYTKDVHDGNWAAELRNTAAGRGNTSSSSSSYDFNNVPGELFIGGITVTTGGTSAKPDGDHYDIDKGTEFVSRPTGLRFYYKYAPYMTDAWKVYIALYDEAGNVIAENTVTDGIEISSYKEMEVSFNYIENLDVVPAKIYVYFASSIYSGSELPYHTMDVTTWYNNSQRTDETLSGSVFCVDDISLVYDK